MNIIMAEMRARIVVRLARLVVLVMLVMVCGGGQLWAQNDVLVGLDDEEMSVKVMSITWDGEIEVRDGGGDIDLYGLRRIERRVLGDKTSAVRDGGGHELYMVDGSRIVVKDVRIDDEKLRFAWAYGDEVVVELERVKGVRFGDGDIGAGKVFDEILRDGEVREDRIVAVDDDGKAVVVGGVLTELNENGARFIWKGESRRMAIEKVCGIAIASGGGVELKGDGCRVYMYDGSVVWSDRVKLEDGELSVRSGGVEIAVPWSAVMKVEVFSDRLVFLSDMVPSCVDAKAMFTFAGYKRDRSVLGNGLRIGDREYGKGIGVHAPCGLRYEIGGGFEYFVAMIGIDRETMGRGDCVFKIFGDGKILFEKRMRASDGGFDVKVGISGVREIELRVEVGEDLDLADHGDWCDARLIR